jgi:hypothetical protein
MEETSNPFQAHDESELEAFLEQNDISPYSPQPPGDSLDERYHALQAREIALLHRQQQLQQSSTHSSPNWPPYISFLYVDFDSDIPQPGHSCIKTALFGIIIVLVQSLINIVASCSVTGLSTRSFVKSIIFAVIFALITCYLTIAVCFDKLYNGCKTQNITFSFVTFQFVLIGWLVYLITGFPSSGSVGFATFIDMVAKTTSIWPQLIALLNTFALLISLSIQIAVMRKAQLFHKVSGVPENMQTMVLPEDGEVNI